jgi:hypothetical protein
MKLLNVAKAIALSAAFSTALSIPVDAGQGRGRGHQKHDGVTVLERDSTPGVPTSPRGRGRNLTPRVPRGRIIRTVTSTTTNHRNLNPGTPRRRRVRGSGHRH